MTKIYLIRHAEAEGNLYRRAQGVYDGDITPRGRKQVEALKYRFLNESIDAVYSSDLTRALKTSLALTGPRGMEPIKDARLREYDLGVWEDKTWGEIEWETPDELITFNEDSFNWSVSGSETFLGCRRRVTDAIIDIAVKNDGKSIAIFSHGCAIRCFLSGIINGADGGSENVPHSDNTNVSLLEYDRGEFKLLINSDCSHVTEEISTFAHQKWWKEQTTLDNTNLRFVTYSEEHLPALISYIQEAGHFINEDNISPEKITAHILKCHRSFPGAVKFAFSREFPAGCLVLDTERDKSEGVGNISFFCMDSLFRGTGMAVQLLGEAISVYRKLGRSTLRVRVAPQSKKLIMFLTENDFAPVSSGDAIIFERSIHTK